MDPKKILEKLHNSGEFMLWQKDHSGYYLAHVFAVMDEANKDTWQIGYYNSKKDRMVTFIMTPEQISATPEQEVMKAKQKINELKIDKIKLGIDEAIGTAQKCKNEHYNNEIIMKTLFIIQEIDGAPMFNITYLAQGFKTINIKINAIDGKVVKHTIGVIAEFS